jgi:hypothetical protein
MMTKNKSMAKNKKEHPYLFLLSLVLCLVILVWFGFSQGAFDMLFGVASISTSYNNYSSSSSSSGSMASSSSGAAPSSSGFGSSSGSGSSSSSSGSSSGGAAPIDPCDNPDGTRKECGDFDVGNTKVSCGECDDPFAPVCSMQYKCIGRDPSCEGKCGIIGSNPLDEIDCGFCPYGDKCNKNECIDACGYLWKANIIIKTCGVATDDYGNVVVCGVCPPEKPYCTAEQYCEGKACGSQDCGYTQYTSGKNIFCGNCPSVKPICQLGHCLQCLSNTDCGGKVCLNNKCSPCSNDGQCNTGYKCGSDGYCYYPNSSATSSQNNFNLINSLRQQVSELTKILNNLLGVK